MPKNCLGTRVRLGVQSIFIPVGLVRGNFEVKERSFVALFNHHCLVISGAHTTMLSSFCLDWGLFGSFAIWTWVSLFSGLFVSNICL